MKTRTSLLLIVSLIFGFLFYQSEAFAQKDKKSDSEKTTDTSNVLRFVEEMPEFPGGQEELYAFLRNNLSYPQKARDKGIEGTVIIQFIVEKDGRVSNVKVTKPVHPELDQEAVRVTQKMPRWKPGKSLGKYVRVYYQLPFVFKLQ